MRMRIFIHSVRSRWSRSLDSVTPSSPDYTRSVQTLESTYPSYLFWKATRSLGSRMFSSGSHVLYLLKEKDGENKKRERGRIDEGGGARERWGRKAEKHRCQQHSLSQPAKPPTAATVIQTVNVWSKICLTWCLFIWDTEHVCLVYMCTAQICTTLAMV